MKTTPLIALGLLLLAASARADELAELEARLARPDLPAEQRRRDELARPRLLLAAGRDDEARADWEALLRRGEDVAADLLALSGARLAVAVGPVRAGQTLPVTLEGERTGPLTLRLYRVEPTRLRAALEAEPARGLEAHLRAPAAAALSRVAQWDAAAPTDAPVTTRTAEPVPAGTYLLTVTARGVAVPVPVRVTTAVPVLRRAAGPGLLWLLDRAGEPLPGVALRALDEAGVPGAPLGQTGPDGLLAWDGLAPRALAWVGPELLVLDLPPARPPLAAAPARVELDLPVHRPGQPVRARVTGLRADAPLEARLVDPTGVPLATAVARTDATGAGEWSLRLPPDAPPGPWTVEVGPARAALRVLSPIVPGVEVDVVVPEATLEPRLTGRVTARLATGRPLEGRAVRWTLRALDAEPGLDHEPGPGPAPPYALRPLARDDAGQVVSSGTLALDQRGEAPVDVPLPRFVRPTLLRLEAEVLLAGGEVGAPPAAVGFTAVGTRDLLLWLRAERQVVAPTATVGVEVRACRLDGRPAALADLTLFIERRPDAGPLAVERRAVRTDEQGHARTHVVVDAPGTIGLRLDGTDPQGRPVQVIERVRVVAEGAAAAAGAPAGRLALSLEAPLAPGQATARLLADLPFARGLALLTTEPADGAGAVTGRVLEVTGGRARVEVPAGELSFGLVALDAGAVGEARLSIAPAVERLAVSGRAPERPDAPVATAVRAGEAGRLARVAGWLYPDATARVLVRSTPRREGAAPVASDDATRPRGPATQTPPAWPALACLDAAADWTNGLGSGSLRLAAPGPSFARLVARDRRGQTGEGWVRLAPPAPPLAVRVVGPAHAVEGDRAELVVQVEVLDRDALPPGAALTVRWRALDLDVKGSPRVEGSRLLFLGDAGTAALRVEPARALRVLLPAALQGGAAGTLPTRAGLEVTVEVEGTPLSATTAWSVPVRARGLVVSTAQAGVVPPGGRVEHPLEVPPGHLAGASRLVLAVDVDARTAALSAVAALASSSDPLRGPGQHLVAWRRLAQVFAERRLAGRVPGQAPDAAEVLASLAAARDAQGAWGPHTSRVTRLLLELRAAGVAVPEGLVVPALDALARDPARARDGGALLALALGGRLDGPTAAAVNAPALPGDERPLAARALFLARQARRAEEALAAAIVGAGELRTVEARAELLALLVERGQAPELQQELLAGALAARAGPGWSDPDDGAAAARALTALARREAEDLATRVDALLEGQLVHTAWSGAGLGEWIAGPGLASGALVARRARLEVRAEGARPATWSARVDALVRADGPPARQGLALERRVLRRLPGGEPEPIGVAGVLVGDALRLVVDLQGEGGAPPDLRDLLLEVPLPGGCLVARRPPGSRLEDGVLVVAPLGPRVEVDLLALWPGEHRLLRARARSLRGGTRVATSDEVVLRVR